MDTPLEMNECDLNDADNMDSGHAVQGSAETESTEIQQEPSKSSEIKDCSNNGTDANVSDKDVQKSNPEDDELEENNSIGKKQSTVLDSDTKAESISTEKLEDSDINKGTDTGPTNNTLEDKDEEKDDKLKENSSTGKKQSTVLDSDAEEGLGFTEIDPNKETDTILLNKTLESEDEQKNTEKETNSIPRKPATIADNSSEDKSIFTFNSESPEKLERDNANKETNTDSLNDALEGKDKENNSIHRKLATIVDSDSEDERIFAFKSTSPEKLEHDNPNKETNTDSLNKTLESTDKQENTVRRQLMAIVDSDSEDESMFVSKSGSKKGTYKSSGNKKNRRNDFDSDSDEASSIIIDNDNKETISTTDAQSRPRALAFLDSETDDDEKQSSPTTNKKRTKKQLENKSKSKLRKVSVRASKNEAMKQIHSETQRLIRKMTASLPYHKPKQRTLAEFLSRKRVITALPKAPTMAAKLKMSSAIVDEVLKEKEKEAEIFYKSSDSEVEIIEDYSSDKENLPNGNQEESTANKAQEVLAETKESEASSETKNANDSLIVEVHCDFEDAGNVNSVCEVSENEKANDTSDKTIVLSESENNTKSPGSSAAKGLNEGNKCGLPPPNVSEQQASLKPKLKGAPGTIIDLTDDIEPNKTGVNALINRFMNKHSKVSGCSNEAPTVTATHIVDSPNGILIVKERLPYKSSAATNEDPKLQKPGAKLARLKEELKHKMALKRDEEWKQREQEMKEQEIEWDDSIIEEDHLSDSVSPSDEEEELEEDDVRVIKRKKGKRSAYIDDEAEVSDDYINDSDEAGDELSEDEEDNDILSDNENGRCKMFKRIVEPSDDDSRSSIIVDQEKSSLSQIIGADICDVKVNERYSDIQVNNPKCETPQIKTSCFDLVSPVTQLTALNAHAESEDGSPEIKKQLPINKTDSLIGSSQEINDLWKESLPRRNLFADQSKPAMQDKLYSTNEPNITESQLLDLCSGTFTSQVSDPKESTSEFFDEMSQSVQKSPEKNIAPSNKYRVASSDEEDSATEEINNRSKRKAKKLDLSDDESEKDSDDESAKDSVKCSDEEDDQEKYIDYDSEENEVVVSKKNIKQYAATFLEEEAELSESDCDVSADENEDGMDKLELEEADEEDIDESQVKSHLERIHMKEILNEDQKEVRMLKEILFEDGDLYSESKRERKFKWRNIDKQQDNNDSPLLDDKDGWVDLSDDEEESTWRQMKLEREKFIAEQMKKVTNDMEEELCTSELFKCGLKILKKRRIDESVKQDTKLEDESRPLSRLPRTVAEMLDSRRLDGSSSVMQNILRKRSFLAKGEEALARLAAVVKRTDKGSSALNNKNFVFRHIEPSTEEGSSSGIKIQPKPLITRKRR